MVNYEVLFTGPAGTLLAHCMDEVMEAPQMGERESPPPGNSQGWLGPAFCLSTESNFREVISCTIVLFVLQNCAGT